MHPEDFDADEWLAYLGPLDESCVPAEEPDWANHPVYAEMVSDAERIKKILDMPAADRPTGELARIDARGLHPASRVDLLSLYDQQEQYVRAAQMRLLAEMDRTDSTLLGLSGELASLVLRLPRTTAQTRLKTARTLVDRLPATLTKLSRGEITARHAEVITEASWNLEPDIVSEFEAAVLPGAEDRTVRSLQNQIATAVLRLDPASAEARHQRALKSRSVGFQPVEDGMVQLPVLLDAPDGQAVFTRLTALAAGLPKSDPRTMDQKRADLLVDAVLTGLPSGRLPKLQGRRPSVHVVVSADTLLNLDDNPGHLAGYGPITAETARRLAADESGTWWRLLTDPDTGHLLDISADHYRPAQRLRDFVGARDDTCVFPGCNQPAYRCEFEHTISFGKGGKTCRQGGALACKRHNLCKIDTGWGYRHNPDTTYTWTTDTGHEFTTRPVARWPMADDRPPPSRPRPIPEQLWAEEDREYEELRRHWQYELDSAIADVEPAQSPSDDLSRHDVSSDDVPNDHVPNDHVLPTDDLPTGYVSGDDVSWDDLATWRVSRDRVARDDGSRHDERVANARAALLAIQDQRERQLRHRSDPEEPPF